LRKSGIAGLSVVIAAGTISAPFVAGAATGTTANLYAKTTVGKQLAELKGSDTVKYDYFGVAAAISGTTAVVGASGHAGGGRAYVFTKTSKGWKQAGELKGSDTIAGDDFGAAVAISGTSIVIGAQGHGLYAGRAYVFTKTSKGWKQAGELKGSDTVAGAQFGGSVTIAGTTAVIGAANAATASGRAYVFAKTAKGWKQAAELKGSDTTTNDGFGNAVSISGTTVIIGAHYHAQISGRAYVFAKTAKGWKQAAELKGSDTVADDYFGASVGISGTTAVIGADNHATRTGRAYVFTKTAKGWKQAAELKGSDSVVGDYFGNAVGISGTTIITTSSNHADSAGRAYVFTKTGKGWKQAVELKGTGAGAPDGFGTSVGISGTTAIVGANVQAVYAGRAYVFQV
jgi:hypothetical protein